MDEYSLNKGLPPDFVFNQSNLQDYVDCPRRFQLRYIVQFAWPALDLAPGREIEQKLYDGNLFHLLIHQHQLGIPFNLLDQYAQEEPLLNWWKNYIKYDPGKHQGESYSEVTFEAEINDYPLIAKYDFLIISPGVKATLFDWKTSEHLPKLEWLKDRMQTRVYQYVLTGLKEFPADNTGISPENIDMTYWFANYPEASFHITYSQEQYLRDQDYFKKLVNEIKAFGDQTFPLTPDPKKCLYCRYRSFCDRGVKAGDESDQINMDLETENDSINIDFEQIAEIEF